MSDVLGPRRRRGRADAAFTHDADPWWGVEPARVAAVEASTRDARAAPSGRRDGTGWLLLGLALAPFAWASGRIRRSPWMRRLIMRGAILGMVLTFLACSVGVILVNNVVIGRTAELGTLDDRRRELRRENAVLGDEAARLSAPPLVQGTASRELGMVRANILPKFIFLDPANRTLTPLQRARIAQRVRRQQATAAARAARAPTPAAASGEAAP